MQDRDCQQASGTLRKADLENALQGPDKKKFCSFKGTISRDFKIHLMALKTKSVLPRKVLILVKNKSLFIL
jgi:hypothetical protein